MEEKEKIYEFIEEFDPSSIDIYTREGRWTTMLHEFERQTVNTVKFTLPSAVEKNRCRSSIKQYIKRHGHDWVVYPERGSYNIYVVKA